MKELSVEEKVKAYDEALKKAKDMLSYKEVRREDMEYLFPELTESEDERIRKELICGMYALKEQHRTCFASIPIDNVIAWLEKQGEFYTKRDVDNAYLEGMAFAKDELEKQNKQILANSAKTCKDEHKPTDNDIKEALRTEYEKGRADAIAEMQVAWSKEDEINLGKAIWYVENPAPMVVKDSMLVEWLKSLRHQNTWKPSDEQMKALRVLNLTGNISYAGQGQVLIELYNDLKKLTE